MYRTRVGNSAGSKAPSGANVRPTRPSDSDRKMSTSNVLLPPSKLGNAKPDSAAIALETTPDVLVREADSLMFCLSKGLACPIGSVICGDGEFIGRARKNRRMVGGGMRQIGVIAAAGIVALDEMVDRLADDHANARPLAEGLATIPGLVLDPALTTGLVALAAKSHVTLYTLVQALWGLLLGRYNDTADVVFGSVVSGRPADLEGVEQMVGVFINTVPVRVAFDEEATFATVLRQLQTATLDGGAFEYQPLWEVQSTNPLGRELFDHIMIFENYPASAGSGDGEDAD